MKFRKRAATNLTDLSPISTTLRSVRDQIQRRNFPGALSTLNTLLSGAKLDTATRARVLSFVADSQFEQGKYADAVAAYQQASALSLGQTRTWLRPGMGHVISLLRNAQPEQALAQARALVQTAISVQAQARPALTTLTSRTMVAARPWNADAVATRLGKQFLGEGEITAAKELLAQAQQINPRPTLATSLALALVAEHEDRLADAASLARQTLAVGNYQAKTLSVWPLLLRVNHQLGVTGVDGDLLAALAKSLPSVRARATLIIVKTLRSQNVPQWSQLASGWLTPKRSAAYPRVAAEFQKLLLSTQRLQADAPGEQSAAALRLQATPLVSPQEFLFGIKEQVRASCFTNPPVPADWRPLVAQMVARYGEKFRAQGTHSLALSYLQGQRHDLARAVLQANVATTAATDPAWAKSVAALARLERTLGNDAEAARWFLTLNQNASVAPRFRLYALLGWVQEVLKSASPVQASATLAQARPQLQAAIAQAQDYTLLLDLGRHLSFGPAAVRDLAGGTLDRGVQLAQTALTQASDASHAAVILAKMAQRQSDLKRFGDVTTYWESLSTDRKNWLWSSKTEFWEYLALVFQAYDDSGKEAAAEALATTYINDTGTPPAAVTTLAMPYGAYLMRVGRCAESLRLFGWAVPRNPSASVTAVGYYWLALSAWKAGDRAGAQNLAGNLLLALGQHAGELMDHHWQGKALIIQAGMQPTGVSTQAVGFSPTKLQQLAVTIQGDLGRLH